ncbi:MAG: hypothetical protein IH600_03955 [Bacteroidetes bacterium]|nr:hypothetical protein [Bacteroidota bacterium]
MESMLRELIPDLDARLARFGYTSESAKTTAEGLDDASTEAVPDPSKPNPDLLTEEMFVSAIEVAKNELRARGHDPADIQFMVSLENDSSFRSQYLSAIKDMIRTGGDRSELQRVTNQVAKPVK